MDDDFIFNKMSGIYDVYYNDEIDGFLVIKQHIKKEKLFTDQLELAISNIIDKRVPQV